MFKLKDLAIRVRSKNAEPFYTTLDIYFPDEASYAAVRDSGSVTAEGVAAAYNVPVDVVWGIFFVDEINVAKVTLFKWNRGGYQGCGDPSVTDMFGSQQHIPMLELDLAVEESVVHASWRAADKERPPVHS
jgi:hypothetical protein